jgi:hypothetical protein
MATVVFWADAAISITVEAGKRLLREKCERLLKDCSRCISTLTPTRIYNKLGLDLKGRLQEYTVQILYTRPCTHDFLRLCFDGSSKKYQTNYASND